TRAICPDHRHNAGCGLSFDGGLQGVNGTTFRRRAMPCINGNVGSSQWVALAAAYRVRREEPFHALEVSGRCAVTLIQVTTTDPFRERRHPNLVAHVVIPNRSPDRMRAMSVVVARKRRIIAAGIS